MSFKVFEKWSVDSIEVRDAGLERYIVLESRMVPYTRGRHATQRFGKTNVSLIERLINKMTVTGHLGGRTHKRVSGRDTGKKTTAYNIVKKSLEIVEKKTKQNPVQVLVRAVENSAPRDETTSFRQGGIIAQKSVDTAPIRRLDLSLKFISHGAGKKAFKTKKSVESALADEIIMAANNDLKGYAVSRKEEVERIAESAR